MPLEDTDIIDLITQRGADGRYGLVITDTGGTTEPVARMDLLRQKLHRYLHAVINGQLDESCPGSQPTDFFIQVVCQFRPTREMLNISRLTAQSETSFEIPVHFTAFPDSSWEEDQTETAGSGVEFGEEMQQAIQQVLETAGEWLAEDRMPHFVFWLEDGEEKLAAITEAGSHEEMISRVTTWASKFGNPARLCILINAVKSGDGSLPVDTIIAYCCERGEPLGVILTQEIGQDPQSGNLILQGKITFVEECPNFFPKD